MARLEWAEQLRKQARTMRALAADTKSPKMKQEMTDYADRMTDQADRLLTLPL